MNELVLLAAAHVGPLWAGWSGDTAAEAPTPAGVWILGRWAGETVLN